MDMLTGEMSQTEPKPSLCLEGQMLDSLGIKNPQVGQCLDLAVEACITGINIYDGEDGKEPSLRFEIEAVKLAGAPASKPDTTASAASKFYPGMSE